MDNKMMGTATRGLAMPKKEEPKKAGKKSVRMTIEPAEPGFIVENHEHEDGMPTGSMTKHPIMDATALHAHLDKHYGKVQAEAKPDGKVEPQTKDKMAQPEGKPAPAAGAKEVADKD